MPAPVVSPKASQSSVFSFTSSTPQLGSVRTVLQQRDKASLTDYTAIAFHCPSSELVTCYAVWGLMKGKGSNTKGTPTGW